VNHLLDTTPAIAVTYVYWPYGEVITHSGADTKMQFVGAAGYYTGVVNRVYYKVAYYRPDVGRRAAAPPGVPPLWSQSWRSFPGAGGGAGTAPPGKVGPPVHRYGPVPGYFRCLGEDVVIVFPGDKPVGGFGQGFTNCHVPSGRVFSLDCIRQCGAECVDAHEGQHRHDMRDCCARAALCGRHHGSEACQSAWGRWTSANRRWFECRAAHSGLDCVLAAVARGCAHGGGGSACGKLGQLADLFRRAMARACRGVTEPWGPMPRRCPYGADGSMEE
jgi:hypothetical protein